MTMYFDDFQPGDTYEYGEYTLSKPEMLDFAEQFDPQPIHVDEAAAAASEFGGLIASGLHTFCIASRLTIQHFFDDVAHEAGVGLESVRWRIPVRPGDTLSVRTTVTECRDSTSRPATGVVTRDTEVLNQDDDVVMSWTAINLVAKRPATDD